MCCHVVRVLLAESEALVLKVHKLVFLLNGEGNLLSSAGYQVNLLLVLLNE